ncbi:MAG: 3,4-dihydroxy-2-butanone-4-phosphate synthase [Candidatus Nanohaloarchaeota archaeon QJJ-7]|nr:3,4-dihydroxy-2-butanone-4-phosphate synthase [Candidatus Nanohaloarchaeota archaeon QJJ-7]
MGVEEALRSLQEGGPVLVYDSDGREEETDVIIPAGNIGWRDVRFLRNEAGGLICVAMPWEAGERFEIPLLEEKLDFGGSPEYDDRSSFSLPVNHRSTRTGVTDRDRATTIRELAEALETPSLSFREEFRSPGHVPILLAAEELLDQRCGHTELAVNLMKEAGLKPAAVVSEMIDDDTGRALQKREAENYANENGLVFVEGQEIAQM